MAEHTPGPWKQIEYDDWLYIGGAEMDLIEYSPIDEPYNYAVENFVCVVDRVDNITQEGYATANLIAAAPDLLEACISFVNAWGNDHKSEKARGKAYDAIDKARGIADS